MRIETKPDLTGEQKQIIMRLWNAEYPAKISYTSISDFENFLDGVSERTHYLLFDDDEALRGWLMTFTREGERWFSVIVDGSSQKKGFGRALIDEIKRRESEIHGWVVPHSDSLKTDGTPYVSPLEFYRKNDFEVLENVVNNKSGLPLVKITWTNKNNSAD